VGLGETVSGRVAIGIGCRKGIAAEAVIRLVTTATTGLPPAIGLYTIEDKRDEAGLIEAAERLGLPLCFLTHTELSAMAPLTVTPSPAAEARFGLPSIAEAAALGAFAGKARLIVPRQAEAGVTVAIAEETL
jgi:cobalamin biosynthesis protein CbiG